ncbi:CbiQ family ECF transporter T component [Methanogenium cariaci]|uniref:CbiQ family ECF transporter T component n=1 Tax=Methanogenium cariaci TaxID=2197 RepID=UPI001FDFCFE7|nr:CbiQ family ECF transporter T component [Methanogenium cariaci]
MRPEVIILDEPTTGLDPAEAERIMGIIRSLSEAGHTVLMVSHDMSMVRRHAQRIIHMEQGRITSDKPASGRCSIMAEILQYKRIDGVFHRMNALTKIGFLLVVIALAILSTDPLVLAGLILLVFSLALVGRFGRELLAQVPMLIFLSAGLIFLTVLTMQSGDMVGYLIPTAVPVIGGHIPVTTGALHFAAVLSLRFFVMLFTFQLMIISTQPRDLITALRRLHLPVDYALMLLIAIRFIPSLQLEGRRIQEAQRARAYNPGAGLRGKIKELTPPIIVPPSSPTPSARPMSSV